MIWEINNMLLHWAHTHTHSPAPTHTHAHEASLWKFINIFQTRGSIEENNTYSIHGGDDGKKRELKNRTHALVRFFVFYFIGGGLGPNNALYPHYITAHW